MLLPLSSAIVLPLVSSKTVGIASSSVIVSVTILDEEKFALLIDDILIALVSFPS